MIFSESQRFTQWWLWAIVLGSAAAVWLLLVASLANWGPIEDDATWIAWIIWVLFGVGLPLLMARLRLDVTVQAGSVSVRFVPLTSREIELTDVTAVAARTYRPIREYGGWGIRGTGDKRAYNVSGDRGVELTLADGRSVLIGSQRADELAGAIDRARRA